MSNLRRRFIRDLKIRNYSDRTITSYVNALIGLSKFYSRCPSNITTPEIRDYLKYLTDQGKSWSTINLVLSACNLLYQETLQQPEKIQSIGRPKLPKMLPVVFSEEEVELLLSHVKNIKHKAILMTIYSAGLRCGELCNLKITDIDSSRLRIIVRNAKGHKDREVILSRKLLDYLRYYFQRYRPKIYLFHGHSIGQSISARTIQVLFKKTWLKSAIQKNASLHTLRHSYATHLMNQGIDIRIIQQLLGYKSIKTTLIYCHLTDDRFLNTKSPLDSLNL